MEIDFTLLHERYVEQVDGNGADYINGWLAGVMAVLRQIDCFESEGMFSEPRDES